ncbi:hypothetical protein BGX27_001089, partial [Mortierella sp. AM989]
MTETNSSNEINEPTERFKGNDFPPAASDRPPLVLISGAGIAGLFLGILLEKANIPYQIYERGVSTTPIADSIMSLGGNILPAIEQLGLYEDLLKISYPSNGMKFMNASLGLIGEFIRKDHSYFTGYDIRLFARPEFQDLLRSRIPPEKIHMSKKVMSFLQNDQGVMIRLQDGTCVHGDILVGADGPNSAVRQHLFRDLEKYGKLPKSDALKTPKGFICMVGITEPLDPEKCPGVEGPDTSASLVVGDGACPYSWALFNIPGNRIAWNVIAQINTDECKDVQLRCSEWASVTNEAMIKDVYDFKTNFGKLGDLIDKTPREKISRVYLEDMIYDTWQYCRTVLVGDAAHKLLPSTGQGGVNAMQDAVILANCLYDLKPLSYEGIRVALSDYYDQRYRYAKLHYESSRMAAKLQFGHTKSERLLRHITFNLLPKIFLKKHTDPDTQYRPYVAFLPTPPIRETGN